MKQKNYTFEQTGGTASSVELHRKGRRLHIVARLVCLVLALAFWLMVSALAETRAENGDAAEDLPFGTFEQGAED